MHGIFLLLGWFMMMYSWFLGCLCVADKEFRRNEGKRTVKLLLAAWVILCLLWYAIDRQ